MKGKIIVRLIDIVLILLFGFISISEIDKKSQVRLSESRAMSVSHADQEDIIIVAILNEGEYLIENIDLDDGVGNGTEIKGFQNLAAFIYERHQEAEERGHHVKVRIRSNWYLPAKHTLDVAIFCEQLSIERSLDVKVTSVK